ncbi:MAG: extracellular solute-binding protein [Terrimicrobiaceae bacterium]|nr:extracellular solute-binding protein [Terrimicrobiaceae bacterium]
MTFPHSALFSLLLLSLSACGKKSGAPQPQSPAVKDAAIQVETSGEPDPMAVPSALRGGSYATWGGAFPKSLNMWLDYNSFSAQVCGLMFEPLVEMHSTKDEPVGALAKSWEISPDGKTYTFTINPAARWSDGQPVTAEDIQFYYDVMMNPKNLTSLFRVDLSRFARPEVVDAHTVRITASEPHWKNFWTAAGFVALPKHAWKDADFNKQNFEFPVVSGPYELSDVKMNRSITLKRRGNWWGRVKQYNVGKYNFDQLVFKSTEDRNKVLEMLKKGDIDAYPVYTAQIWAEKTDFPQVQKNWIVRQNVFNKEPKAFQGLALNMRRPILQDVRVRQALAHLLNRALMNEKLMFNQYFLLNSYFPDLYPNNQNPAAPITEYDPEKARALLKDSGWQVGPDGVLAKDGQAFSLTILHYDNSDLRHLNIYLQDLKAVGIDAKLDIVSRATFTKRVDSHDFDMIWTNWSASRLRDPETLWSSKTADDIATQNLSGVKDAEIDKLITRQKTEMDLGKRNEILKQIDARLVTIVPYVLMWQSGSARLLYWNKFGTLPTVLPKYGTEDAALVYWWLDPAKDAALQAAQKSGAALPALPAEVHFPE